MRPNIFGNQWYTPANMPKKADAAHYHVEVSYHEICVVQLNVQRRVTQDNAREAA